MICGARKLALTLPELAHCPQPPHSTNRKFSCRYSDIVYLSYLSSVGSTCSLSEEEAVTFVIHTVIIILKVGSFVVLEER